MLEKLADNILFKGFTKEEMKEAFEIFEAKEVVYEKNEIVFREGERTEKIGIITKGNILAERSSLQGHTYVITNKFKNEIIGETCAIVGDPFIVSLITSETTSVVYLNVKKLIDQSDCFLDWKAKFIKNLLIALGEQSDQFAHRIIHISPRVIRGRIIAFLKSCADKNEANEFDIQFNRQQMANDLNVDRSALSNELSKMRSEGLIDFKKNHFTLLKPVHLIVDL